MFRCNQQHHRHHQHTLQRFSESIIYSKLSYLHSTQKQRCKLCIRLISLLLLLLLLLLFHYLVHSSSFVLCWCWDWCWFFLCSYVDIPDLFPFLRVINDSFHPICLLVSPSLSFTQTLYFSAAILFNTNWRVFTGVFFLFLLHAITVFDGSTVNSGAVFEIQLTSLFFRSFSYSACSYSCLLMF